MKIKCVCAECKKEYLRYPSLAGKYCSRHCLAQSKKHGSQLCCVSCNKSFYRRFGEQDETKRINQFCSRDCYATWRKLNRKNTYPRKGNQHIHRIVAERFLGRPLRKNEIVHHLDLDKENNDPSNLVVFPNQSYHARCHFGRMSKSELRRFHLVKKSNG